MERNLEEEFLKILSENKRILYKIANVYCPDIEEKRDLFQEITISLWKAFPYYRQEAKISTWIYKVALNTAITNYRKNKRKIRSSPLNDRMFDQLTTHLSENMEEEIKILYEAISKLLPVDKAIILLYLEENSYQTISDITGIPVGNIGMKIKRSKEKLLVLINKINNK
jgi:RNA polymerase sigma-70 factor (ECF subfamily)